MKKRHISTALLAVIMAIGTASCSKEADTTPGKQTTCPVMKGEKINPDLFVDANGKRIYACCPGCVVQIKAAPDKYIIQMEAEGVVLEETPAAE